MLINSYDIDGVIYLNEYSGLTPRKEDIIITGRSIEEACETLEFLHSRGIYNQVFFNPLHKWLKSRESSGIHKASILNMLQKSGYTIGIHFEDDEIQIEAIKGRLEQHINIVEIRSNLVKK